VSASITKLFEAQSIWAIAQTASRVLGMHITADDGEWGHYCWSDVVLGAHSQRIAGGTDEIQHNIIGERGLGLPREPR
jgi:alkylation response protein AidB-like acyl-CoA dehydrogenase